MQIEQMFVRPTYLKDNARMSRLIYSLLFYLLLPLVVLRLLYRSLKAPAYRRRWAERFGFIDLARDQRPMIWLHSVSVGETLAAIPLVRRLLNDYPGHQLLITTMTPTGSERVRAVFGDQVLHCYAPYDLPDAVARFLRRAQPALCIIMETELWPNTIAGCVAARVPVVLANARLSEKSARGYQRFTGLTMNMLQGLSAVAAQHDDDAQRFLSLGLPAASVAVTGNIKFDLTIDEELRQHAAVLGEQWRGENQRPVWLVASTHRGEDEIILDAFAQIKQRLPECLLVLVPRHPERFNDVALLCRQRGFTLARRSADEASGSVDILLGDTMGELMMFFGACDLAFIGGSLVPTGGHNMIEAAAWGAPVITGPHLFNFAEASRLLLNADAMIICDDAAGLAESVGHLLEDKARRTLRGEAARLVAEANRGALDRLLAIIARQLD